MKHTSKPYNSGLHLVLEYPNVKLNVILMLLFENASKILKIRIIVITLLTRAFQCNITPMNYI